MQIQPITGGHVKVTLEYHTPDYGYDMVTVVLPNGTEITVDSLGGVTERLPTSTA